MATIGWLGHRRITLATCTSTSDLALAEARAGCAHGTVVVADEQTAGRGRLGRPWASPPGHLYLSAVVRVDPAARPPAERAALTLAVGIGLIDALRGAGARAAALKWPNDVVAFGRKLAGVLCEATGDAIVVGVGVNLAGPADELAPELQGRATTLAAVIGGDGPPAVIDRAAFTDLLLASVEPWLDRFVADGPRALIAAWEERMAPGLRLAWDRNGAPVAGKALGLDPDGALRLLDDDGTVHRVVAGDVAILA